jgi:hypothetical protein
MKLRNNIAAFGWVVSLCFLAGCLAFTYILIRDGSANIQIYPPDIPGYYPSWLMPLVLSIFWLAGLAVASHLANIPCVQVEVLADKSVLIVKRYLFWKKIRIIPHAKLTSATVAETTDIDGAPYFFVQLTEPNGETTTIAESCDRQRCQAICMRFNNAIAL